MLGNKVDFISLLVPNAGGQLATDQLMAAAIEQSHKTRRQHYVPVFLIKKWRDHTGRVRILDKRENKYHFASPEDVFVERKIYDLRDPSGKTVQYLEAALQLVESAAAPIIEKINSSEAVTEVDHTRLLLFLAYLRFRNPASLQTIAEGMSNWAYAKASAKMGMAIEEVKKSVIIRPPAEYVVKALFEHVLPIYLSELRSLPWKVMSFENNCLSFCDAPLLPTIGVIPNVGRNMQYQIALSPRKMLLMGQITKHLASQDSFSQEDAILFNQMTETIAHRFVMVAQ
jgi:hypothetical protein